MTPQNRGIPLRKLIEKFDMKVLTNELDVDGVYLTKAEVNRPALELVGFYGSFDKSRPQIIGMVEDEYLATLTEDEMHATCDRLFKMGIPCVIYARDIQPDEIIIEQANAHHVPVLSTRKSTSHIMAEIIRWLGVELAPMVTLHGVLVDVYGEGVLIMGESGIGKSESALELIKRGHRLVSDDVVEVRKVSDDTLVGSAPEITRHFIELRGIGIVNVKTLYGVECVKNTQNIDLVIKLEEWNRDKEYDRLGMIDESTEILGNKVTCHSIPIRPGRNLAIIVESAAVNHRQKKMGYNAARELYERVQQNLRNKMED